MQTTTIIFLLWAGLPLIGPAQSGLPTITRFSASRARELPGKPGTQSWSVVGPTRPPWAAHHAELVVGWRHQPDGGIGCGRERVAWDTGPGHVGDRDPGDDDVLHGIGRPS